MSDEPPKRQTLETRMSELEARGVITPSKRVPGTKPGFAPGKPKRGALKRFLAERD